MSMSEIEMLRQLRPANAQFWPPLERQREELFEARQIIISAVLRSKSADCERGCATDCPGTSTIWRNLTYRLSRWRHFCQQGLDIRKLMESGCRPKRSRFLAEAPIPLVLENTKRHPASTASCKRVLSRAVCTPLRRCTNRQLVVRRCAVSPLMWRTPPPTTSPFRRARNGCAPSANPKQ